MIVASLVTLVLADGLLDASFGYKVEQRGINTDRTYSYVSPDGTVIATNWIADENGFQAKAFEPIPPAL